MIRHPAAIAVALCLSPAWLQAQEPAFTVTKVFANVHKSPSTGSPIIGKVQRGAVLEVTRELGSWVKVHWPDAPDGVGYVHVSMGSLEGGARAGWNPAPGDSTVRSAADAAPGATRAERDSGSNVQLPSTGRVYVAPTHLLGLGGRLGASTLGLGATGRLWTLEGLGVQLEVARETLDGGAAPDRVTSVQFGPSVIYSLPDHLSYHVWLRPYVGAGVNLHRLTLHSGAFGGGPTSDMRIGFRTFGGAELTVASVPRFALSSDLSYQRFRRPFAGVALGGLGLSISGHWYIK